MSLGVERDAPARATPRRARMPHLSLGHLAVAVAALLAFVANVAFLRSMDERVAVAVAARDISGGEPIRAGDLTTTQLGADDTVMAGLVVSLDGTEGMVAGRDIAAGELVSRADLLGSVAPAGMTAMAVPIDPAHAAGGDIRVGDRVDLVDVDAAGMASYVVRDVPVVSVSESGTGALSVSSGRHIVVGLDEQAVLAVAAAIADGEVDVVLTTGAGGG